MIPILVKGDDVRSRTKANARHGWFLSVTASTGVNGLTTIGRIPTRDDKFPVEKCRYRRDGARWGGTGRNGKGFLTRNSSKSICVLIRLSRRDLVPARRETRNEFILAWFSC